MSGVIAEKLYPPTIASSIPAFYVENGTATLAVPFSMNRAVEASSVSGFRLKIKTVQSNTLVAELTISGAATTAAINSRIANFTWTAIQNNSLTPEFNKIKMGQFLKVQMAYIDNYANVGYFSTVAITKYTSKPNVYISDAMVEDDVNAIPLFKQSYIGVYQTTEDTSERPYSYCFYLYNAAKGLKETSNWKLHNTSVNRIVSESIALEQAIDTYTFTYPVKENEQYYIQYGVRTINNLEVFSPLYPVFCTASVEPEIQASLIAKNNFDNAYVEISFELIDPVTTETTWPGNNQPLSVEIARSTKLSNYEDWLVLKKEAFSSYKELIEWSFKDYSVEQGVIYCYSFRQYSHNGVGSIRQRAVPIMADFEDMFLFDGSRQLKLRFNPKVSSFKTTLMEQKIETIGNKYPFIFKNGIVNYKEFPISGLLSYNADNEELFMTKAELGIELAQSQTRSATEAGYQGVDIEYIPVQGEIDIHKTYYIKENEEYTEVHLDQDVFFPEIIDELLEQKRTKIIDTPNVPEFSTYSIFEKDNVRAERLFKLKALEWLNNGEIKLFKSPAEGNYLIRLMNISLTPEDQLGRMLHTMQATAYEVEDLNYSNLINLNLISIDDPEIPINKIESFDLYTFFNSKKESEFSRDKSFLLNNYYIVNSLNFNVTRNTNSSNRIAFYVRIGEDKEENRVFISTDFTLEADGAQLPNVYFNTKDNQELFMNSQDSIKNSCMALVGNTIFTYNYISRESAIGSFYGITNITVRNKVETWTGPRRDSEGTAITFGETSIVDHQVNIAPILMKFWALEFVRKPCTTKLILKDNKYYLFDNQLLEITTFDTSQLYQVIEYPYNENSSNVKIYYSKTGVDLIPGTLNYHHGFYKSDQDFYKDVKQSVTLTCNRALTTAEQLAYNKRLGEINALTNQQEQEAQLAQLQSEYPPYQVTFDTPPIINLYEAIAYNKIEFEWGINMKAAYQERKVTYQGGTS